MGRRFKKTMSLKKFEQAQQDRKRYAERKREKERQVKQYEKNLVEHIQFKNIKTCANFFIDILEKEDEELKESVEEEIDQAYFGNVEILGKDRIQVHYPYIDKINGIDTFTLFHKEKDGYLSKVATGIYEKVGKKGGTFILECENAVYWDKYDKTKFILKMNYDGIPMRRMMQAMKRIENYQTNLDGSILNQAIVGSNPSTPKKEKRKSVRWPYLKKPLDEIKLKNQKLNEKQKAAVIESLTHKLALIQGPPGTGKTVTVLEIIHQFQQKYPNEAIMVTAPSNTAVDHIMHQYKKRLPQHFPEPLRVASRVFQNKDYPYYEDTLYFKGLEIANHDPKTIQLYQRWLETDHERDLKKYEDAFLKHQLDVLDRSKIVFTTCCCAGQYRMQNFKPERVIIDECTQAMEPESWIALTRASQQVVLVGDHKQLGPNILSDLARDLEKSLFQRLIEMDHPYVMLIEQYRMHKHIAEFPSITFYENKLQNGKQTKLNKQMVFPNKKYPIVFLDAWYGKEIKSEQTSSFYNEHEGDLVMKFVKHMVKLKKIKPETIGIITPYREQRSYIEYKLNENYEGEYKGIKVASVDGFQGSERDYIIFSCVRANKRHIGFLSNPCRLNVALTRAKHGLILIGDRQTLRNDKLWSQLIDYYEMNLCVVNWVESQYKKIRYGLPS